MQPDNLKPIWPFPVRTTLPGEDSPPPSCLVSGGGAREPSLFIFQIFVEGWILCVCRLDKVLLLVHCCVLQISAMEGTALHLVSCRTLSFSQFHP